MSEEDYGEQNRQEADERAARGKEAIEGDHVEGDVEAGQNSPEN